MFKTLIARIKQGYRTGAFPPAQPNLPPDFRGRPVIDVSVTKEEVAKACAKCPVEGALFHKNGKAAIDMGKCLFCGRCAAALSGKIRFTKEYRLAVFKREDLVVWAGEDGYEPPKQTNPDVLALKRSLQMREVSAGGCAGCELDANVLGTLAWDMGRFGIRFVASPRHADALYLTGPISAGMQMAYEKTLKAMPEPRLVIAAGACAISGGLYHHGDKVVEPDLFIPGCPPHPATALEALLRFIGR